MRVETLYKKNNHNWMVMGRDPGKRNEVVDTNHYLVQNNGRGILLDPGGVENFSVVAAEFSRHFDLSNIEAIFASHQDPDVISSLSFWIQTNPNLLVYVPKIWVTFITHFGVKIDNIRPIPDEGGTITLGGHDLEAIPAHYLHSSGNLSIYDPGAKILFSGDIGAALLPEDYTDLFVTDFASHTQYMEYFHRRWMPSNTAKARWIAEIRKRDVEMICPQHGAIFKGDDVPRFLSWLENLDVGSGWSNVR
ncbi:MAG: MBL fold metallo-hydrolase [Gammaproteobacteria bacterium]|nr:MBL fold metallo-hydrolase [Gammaproteobacteria bacterium]